MLVDYRKILEIAKYIIENNSTIEEAAKHFNKSNEIIEIYMKNKLKDYSDTVKRNEIEEIYLLVNDIINKPVKKEIKKIDKMLIAQTMLEKMMTVELAAKSFNVSESTIQKYINKELKEIDINLYNEIKKMQSKLITIGNTVGGKNGIRQATWTDFEALEIAETMISDSLTIEEASIRFDVAKSTLYEMVKSITDQKLKDELEMLFEENKKRFGSRN